ncbi:DNA ligase-1 [Halorubrum alkaliphilum]|uniref:DNA ligase n=1 Tax=Halorubrum alkaliphilum TaxID=261290 RepID=A0A8T4GAW9_9EURY|nr:ATP-dependent DNA ligase LigA [Halorubrum alkaliphilum]MBP1921578.1 DNA ligase-1 [Halorubrum alkaliphilum]
MEFAAFADRAERLEAESADLATTAGVADLLSAADDLATVTRFLLGRVFPAHDTRTLDVGPASCHEAIARAAGPNVTAEDVETRLADRGEIGAVAAGFDFGGQRGLSAFAGGRKPLTVAELDRSLRELAAVEGAGSESTKVDSLFGLFNRCEPAEAKVLARLVLGEMRIGVGEGTVRDAIAEAFLVADGGAGGGDDSVNDGSDDDSVNDGEKNGSDAVALVERALQVTNDYGHVAVLARRAGEEGLRAEGLEVGRPVQAMLAQAGTASDAVESFGEVAVETKFDGARVQIHYVPGGGCGGAGDDGAHEDAAFGPRLYSRNMDDVTDALPEIVEFVASRVDVPVILDGEIVAVDDEGSPLPFQEVLRRFRRKHDVDRMRETIPCRLHAFDCLYADGDELLDEPLSTRHERLVEVLPDAAADVRTTTDIEAVESIEADALEAGHEGVMLKDPESAYTPGDRGREWLKRKPAVETLDAVVVGAEWGEGRRAELFGTFLLAVRSDETAVATGTGPTGTNGTNVAADGPDGYATIGKVATGLTDEALADLTERLEPHVVSESGAELRLRPEVVIEVGYEEIQTSPSYGSGFALRFPRFVGVREDKSAAEADSVERVARLAESE